MRNNDIGIYFGIKGIEIVWVKAGKIIDNLEIPAEKYIGTELEEKIPQKTKIITLIKEGLRKKDIESYGVGICFAGRELIIRSFELPLNIPYKELPQAVSYEAKKYIPFKLEEILYDFQIKKEYKEKKILVSFLGIKRETFDFYSSLIREIGLKLNNVEYATFSLFRFARALNLEKKGSYAFLTIDIEDETSFMVIEENFPLFTRDIYIETKEVSNEFWIEKLKSEIQLSLDYYYHRKFPSKHIEKIIILGTPQIKEACVKLSQQVEWILEFVDISDITQSYKYTLSSLKSFGICLGSTVKLPFRFDLLGIWEKERKKERIKEPLWEEVSLQSIKPSLGVIILSIFMVVVTFMVQFYEGIPIKKEIEKMVSTMLKNYPLLGTKTIGELEDKKSDYNNKLYNMHNAFRGYSYITPNLNIIPQLLPQGVWLVELNFKQGKDDKGFLLKGRAYLKDYNKEIEAINKFFSDLKNKSEIAKIYKNIELVSIERSEIEKELVTNFIIIGK
ncbi:MAG: pilus assembly protein PilM [Candidatus Omnitrophica bacterium]|nr:pilus assembly protein PilM [Candidatus Omnitrophota bacterium]